VFHVSASGHCTFLERLFAIATAGIEGLIIDSENIAMISEDGVKMSTPLLLKQVCSLK
jgi:hypothetical protein